MSGMTPERERELRYYADNDPDTYYRQSLRDLFAELASLRTERDEAVREGNLSRTKLRTAEEQRREALEAWIVIREERDAAEADCVRLREALTFIRGATLGRRGVAGIADIARSALAGPEAKEPLAPTELAEGNGPKLGLGD
jgi:hypothetical protein